MLERFKKAYNTTASAEEMFVFDGHQYLASYAKYLIEYLDEAFKEHKKGKK